MPCQGPFGSYRGDNYRKQYLESEKKLCEARWIILRLAELVSEIPPDLLGLIEKHQAEQLDHRLGDKEHVLDLISDAIWGVDIDIESIRRLGGEPGPELLEKATKLRLKRAQIEDLTDDDLIATYWGTEDRLDHKLLGID